LDPDLFSQTAAVANVELRRESKLIAKDERLAQKDVQEALRTFASGIGQEELNATVERYFGSGDEAPAENGPDLAVIREQLHPVPESIPGGAFTWSVFTFVYTAVWKKAAELYKRWTQGFGMARNVGNIYWGLRQFWYEWFKTIKHVKIREVKAAKKVPLKLCFVWDGCIHNAQGRLQIYTLGQVWKALKSVYPRADQAKLESGRVVLFFLGGLGWAPDANGAMRPAAELRIVHASDCFRSPYELFLHEVEMVEEGLSFLRDRNRRDHLDSPAPGIAAVEVVVWKPCQKIVCLRSG